VCADDADGADAKAALSGDHFVWRTLKTQLIDENRSGHWWCRLHRQSHLQTLAAHGFLPVAFDDLSRGHADFVRWGPLVKGDIVDLAALNAAFERHRPVAVIHFAALAYVGESMSRPLAYYRVNVAGLVNVLEAMLRCGTRNTRSFCSPTPNGAHEVHEDALRTVTLPAMPATVTPLVYAIPVQLIAYHTSVVMGTDVDQPPNLAKSVTVE
jgi:hypothetical protein